MMTIENELEALIKSRYRSVLAFSKALGFENSSTVSTILDRGLLTAGFQNIVKICKALGISADGLAEGKIIPYEAAKLGFTTEEVELIQKYRALDERGKRAVNETTEREYGYVQPFLEESPNATGAG